MTPDPPHEGTTPNFPIPLPEEDGSGGYAAIWAELDGLKGVSVDEDHAPIFRVDGPAIQRISACWTEATDREFKFNNRSTGPGITLCPGVTDTNGQQREGDESRVSKSEAVRIGAHEGSL